MRRRRRRKDRRGEKKIIARKVIRNLFPKKDESL
jgi:hypothetical protein